MADRQAGTQVGMGLLLARVGAVVLALGALGYLVVMAQVNAQPADPAPEALPGEAPVEASPNAQQEHFLPSSKSLRLDPEFEREPPAPKPEIRDEFLPSSKSAIGIRERVAPKGRSGKGKSQGSK